MIIVHKIFIVRHGGKNHWEDLGEDGRIIIKWILRKDVGWIDAAQDRCCRRLLSTRQGTFCFHKRREIS
jgi:hypothetical protein